jgi:hypothetical protein
MHDFYNRIRAFKGQPTVEIHFQKKHCKRKKARILLEILEAAFVTFSLLCYVSLNAVTNLRKSMEKSVFSHWKKEKFQSANESSSADTRLLVIYVCTRHCLLARPIRVYTPEAVLSSLTPIEGKNRGSKGTRALANPSLPPPSAAFRLDRCPSPFFPPPTPHSSTLAPHPLAPTPGNPTRDSIRGSVETRRVSW